MGLKNFPGDNTDMSAKTNRKIINSVPSDVLKNLRIDVFMLFFMPSLHINFYFRFFSFVFLIHIDADGCDND